MGNRPIQRQEEVIIAELTLYFAHVLNRISNQLFLLSLSFTLSFSHIFVNSSSIISINMTTNYIRSLRFTSNWIHLQYLFESFTKNACETILREFQLDYCICVSLQVKKRGGPSECPAPCEKCCEFGEILEKFRII